MAMSVMGIVQKENYIENDEESQTFHPSFEMPVRAAALSTESSGKL